MAQSARTLGLEVMDDLSKDWNYILGLRPGSAGQSTWQRTIPGGQGNEEAMDLFANGRSPFLGVLGNGRLEREAESAIYCPFSDARARLSLSWD